jgi:hypothetical protein
VGAAEVLSVTINAFIYGIAILVATPPYSYGVISAMTTYGFASGSDHQPFAPVQRPCEHHCVSGAHFRADGRARGNRKRPGRRELPESPVR